MNAPQPVAERSLQRLRRRYAWLMLALGIPVLGAIVYVLVLHYQVVEVGVQRQLAMSTEHRLAQLDGVLSRMREDLLRLGVAARAPGMLAGEVEVDKRSLASDAQGVYSLDALPVLLREAAPQVILVGPQWEDAARRDAAVERAALFAEHAQLAMARGRRFRRVSYVDREAGEIWIYPWIAFSAWRAELPPAPPLQLARMAARQAGVADADAPPIEGEVGWQLRDAAEGGRTILLSASVTGGEGVLPRFVSAEVPLTALDAVAVDSGVGRFWVVDPESRIVLDRVVRDRPGGGIGRGAPPQLRRDEVEAARLSLLAQEIGPAFVSVRASSVAPWLALYAADRSEVRSRVLGAMWSYIGGAVALLLLFGVTAAFIWRHFGEPSLRLVDYLHHLAVDAKAAEPRVPREWLPWLRLTRDTFAAWRAAAAREQKTEALKSAIVDHALAAVVTTDDQGRIVEFNPAAERMFARTRAEMIGRPASGTITSDSLREAYVEDLRRLRRGEPPLLIGQRVETAALRPDGTQVPVDMVLWRSQVGRETFVTASLFDVSERRAAHEQIERQREALRQAEKLAAMGGLLAGVAHELNNPLAIVMGRASLLEDKCRDRAMRADAEAIRAAAERCGRIVRTFLALARSRPSVHAALQLNDLVRAAVDLLQYNLRTAGVALELELPVDLPQVRGDADRLGQLLLNLLVNAQQALLHVDAPRRLRVATGHGAGRVWLRVADNGIGVPAANRERIFEAFVTTKAEGVGTGLGLAVSRAVALEHGGELRLEDDAPFGRGASFRLELPLRDTAGTPAAAPAPLPAPVAAAQPARVLVVDDEPELVAMMRDALESAGCEVATAESGALALALLDAGHFDAIVSDLRMPDMDGRELWRAVRARDAELARRFVFVTGDTLSPLASAFRRESGAEGLDKPFAAADLVRCVQRLPTRAA